MSERTESTVVVGALPAQVLEVIADFESYPDWTGAVKDARVLATGGDGRPAQVRFVLDAGAIKDTYTLGYRWEVDAAGVGIVTWSLLESQVLKALDGLYELTSSGDAGTRVRYALTVDLRVPMLGMLRRKAEKVIIDAALNELKKRVEA